MSAAFAVPQIIISKKAKTAKKSFFTASVRQRIGPYLHLVDLGRILRAALVVEHRARARHGPRAFAFPAGVRVVDAAVHELVIETERIRDKQRYHLAAHCAEQRLAANALPVRNISDQPNR